MSGGGKREGAGRPPGALNKTTSDIKMLAQSFSADVIGRLAHLAMNADSETAQIAACRELLDRGFGKSVQPQSGPDGESNPVLEVVYRWAAASASEE